MKRISYLCLSLLITVCMTGCSSDDDELLITDSFTNEEIADGSSEAKAYEIDNAYQLKLLASRVNENLVNADGVAYNTCYYRVTKNIDMSPVCSNSESWIVIGTGGNVTAPTVCFKGHFDGNSHTISNLYINESETDYCQMGLFGSVMDATIKNLNVSGSITVGGFSDVPADNIHFGGIAALISNTTIQNCSSSVNMDITASGDTGNKFWRVGGVIGLEWQTTKSSVIDQCSYSGSIKAKNQLQASNAILTVGGVCGGASTSNNSVVKNCYNTGTVTETNDGGICMTYVGGVLGSSSLSDKNNNLYNCYNTGNVSKQTENAESGVGGIVGYVAKGNIVANVYTTQGEVCSNVKGSLSTNCFDSTSSYSDICSTLNLWINTNIADGYVMWNEKSSRPCFEK